MFRGQLPGNLIAFPDDGVQMCLGRVRSGGRNLYNSTARIIC